MMVMMGSDCVTCVGWVLGKDGMMIFQCSALGFPLEFPSHNNPSVVIHGFALFLPSLHQPPPSKLAVGVYVWHLGRVVQHHA